MRSNTLSFYSITKKQADGLQDWLGASATPDIENEFSGNTPLGVLKYTYDYVVLSGQLTVVIVEKPVAMTMASIEDHFRKVLTGATNDDLQVQEPVAAKRHDSRDPNFGYNPLMDGKVVHQTNPSVAVGTVETLTHQTDAHGRTEVIENVTTESAAVAATRPTVPSGTPSKRGSGRTVVVSD
jgi:hypothetical protein